MQSVKCPLCQNVVPWHKALVAKLNSELSRMQAERSTTLSTAVVNTPPEGMDQFNRAQIALWARVVKAPSTHIK
jgi:hypothetical protein